MGRWPRVRPVGPGEGEPHAVSCLEDPRRRLELELDRGRNADLERSRLLVPRPVGEVEDAAAHERGRAVGEDVAETCGEKCHGVRGRDRELDAWVAQDLQLSLERPVVRQRSLVVLALIFGECPRRLARAGDPRRRAVVPAYGDAIVCRALRAPDRRSEPLGGPRRLRAPLAAHLREVGRRPGGSPHEHCDRRLVVDPVLVSSQPAAEPADELGDEVDVRAGYGGRGRHVPPRADDHAARAAQGRVRP